MLDKSAPVVIDYAGAIAVTGAKYDSLLFTGFVEKFQFILWQLYTEYSK
jgi:hypothetical protein